MAAPSQPAGCLQVREPCDETRAFPRPARDVPQAVTGEPIFNGATAAASMPTCWSAPMACGQPSRFRSPPQRPVTPGTQPAGVFQHGFSRVIDLSPRPGSGASNKSVGPFEGSPCAVRCLRPQGRPGNGKGQVPPEASSACCLCGRVHPWRAPLSFMRCHGTVSSMVNSVLARPGGGRQ